MTNKEIMDIAMQQSAYGTNAKDWIKKGLQEIFNNEKRTLVFEGYSWYIRKQ